MSRSRVAKKATQTAIAPAPTRPARSASQRLGGRTASRAAAAPYMPSPKNAEWPNDTMPVYPIRMSDDIARSPQTRISVTKRRQNSGRTSGASASSPTTMPNHTQ